MQLPTSSHKVLEDFLHLSSINKGHVISGIKRSEPNSLLFPFEIIPNHRGAIFRVYVAGRVREGGAAVA